MKTYWQSVEHLEKDPEFVKKAHDEFSEVLPIDEFLGKAPLDQSSASRRDFLKFLGFGLSAASLAACETPVTRAIPYIIKPEEITPGTAIYYASTYADGIDYCSIVVKTREGRPIHIEGNKLSGVSKGGVNARVNASVLSLYDSNRLKNPMKDGQETTWQTIDSEIPSKLKEIAEKGGTIRVLSNSIISPSTQFVIADFIAKYGKKTEQKPDENSKKDKKAKPAPGGETAKQSAVSQNADVKHITYDAVSYTGMMRANETCFGKAVIPDYRFSKTKVIVSIGADFLGNWLSSIEYTSQYAMNRKPGSDMSIHYQFEAVMSLTGSNADVRGAVKPSEFGAVAIALYNHIAAKSGAAKLSGSDFTEENQLSLKVQEAAEDLLKAKGSSLVVCGSNDTAIQTVVNGINNMLGNYGQTIDLDMPISLRSGDDAEVGALVKEMKEGKVDALFIYGSNPAYTMPSAWNFSDALGKVKLKVSFADRLDETASLCQYVCPDSHYLESWSDANPKRGYYSLAQPVIRPLHNTRQAQSSLLLWAGMNTDYPEYIKGIWEKYGFPNQKSHTNFTAFWNKCLHNGIFEGEYPVEKNPAQFKGDLNSAASAIGGVKGGEWELVLYMSTALGEGNQANNPWLQELPDPVSKIVWDNFIAMNPSDMRSGGYQSKLGQEEMADIAKVTVNGTELMLPVVAVPGQRKGTIGIAIGYGRSMAGKAANGIGKNAYPLINFVNGTLSYYNYDVKVEKSGETYPLASTQTHHTMMGRKIVNETTLDAFKGIDRNDKKNGWNKEPLVTNAYGEHLPAIKNNLWKDFDLEKGHRWGMSIDLNACIGCGACVTACTSENNVPVVGKDEVRRNREMHWIRIDRYYSSNTDKKRNSYEEMEVPDEYPEVVYQPVMCQHCNHAPCETVCPVLATSHSTEGLNMMAYNRCVGTRYCANNCPYKVRRFNWFNYIGNEKFKDVNPSQHELARMVLNPDVVVRSRGVMEKCSLCVQRIQAGKLDAKKKGQPVQDGAIQTACASACPANAITFGDVNDEKTGVNKESKNPRSYHLLEEVGVQPNIWYQTKVRNTKMKEMQIEHETEPKV